eukprot:CAMPEP_0201739018 /NCGR_PEP_ID=MMETSP0593-20130828/45554_1 /ASSEMBLY_ACC=CAM_ASM_000672 /TAXON_ID=267983 /ORGANISM="Skeletonema japonicum, Strain CCMP2506" /LENGTH=402 /DNA_ID=CAMNT_0048233255 /DNA_START=69 /DNA_END=1274 /DNA_ORIENTATION=-
MSVTDVYDIREIIQVLQVQEHGIDDEETLARTLDRGSTTQQHQNDTPSTASSGGGTILSSAQTVQTANHSINVSHDENDPSSAGGTILSSAQTVQTANHSINVSHDENDPSSAGSTAPLSVNPSMIDSSLSSFLSSLSDSHASHGSVSSMSSQSTPRHSPASFESIGRFLSTDNECDGISVLSLMTEKGEAALDGEKWWEQIEDWDSFTADANNVLKLLILEEMKKKSADDATDNNGSLQNRPAFFGVWKWFQGLYEIITNATTTGSNQVEIDSERARYVSSLIKQIVTVKQELDELPGEPPSLPKDLTQDDVPDHIREKLLEHHARVNEWRNESMQPRERLEAKYAACLEKLLACIIDTEEQLFWKKGAKQQHSDDNKWSSLNDDGYVEGAETKCHSKSVW